jgi:hypothetical protein
LKLVQRIARAARLLATGKLASVARTQASTARKCSAPRRLPALLEQQLRSE